MKKELLACRVCCFVLAGIGGALSPKLPWRAENFLGAVKLQRGTEDLEAKDSPTPLNIKAGRKSQQQRGLQMHAVCML